MSIGPMAGVPASAAGAPLAQTKGSDKERAAQETTAGQRQAQADLAAENAAGIGQTEEDQQTSERDADGRRLWEAPPEKKSEETADETHDQASPPPGHSPDPTGESGNQLDLSG